MVVVITGGMTIILGKWAVIVIAGVVLILGGGALFVLDDGTLLDTDARWYATCPEHRVRKIEGHH